MTQFYYISIFGNAYHCQRRYDFSKIKNWKCSKLCTILVVIIVKILFISPFLFECLLCNHTFQNKLKHCTLTSFKHFSTTLLLRRLFIIHFFKVVGILLETTPNSIQEYGQCRATFYCARRMVCVPLPSIGEQGALKVSQDRFCISEINLEVLFSK